MLTTKDRARIRKLQDELITIMEPRLQEQERFLPITEGGPVLDMLKTAIYPEYESVMRDLVARYRLS